jgi:hypothetical protein
METDLSNTRPENTMEFAVKGFLNFSGDGEIACSRKAVPQTIEARIFGMVCSLSIPPTAHGLTISLSSCKMEQSPSST